MHSLRFYCGLLSFDWIVVNYENRSFTAYPHSIVCDAFGFHRASRGFESVSYTHLTLPTT